MRWYLLYAPGYVKKRVTRYVEHSMLDFPFVTNGGIACLVLWGQCRVNSGSNYFYLARLYAYVRARCHDTAM